MNIYKNKFFNKWASKEGISDDVLIFAVKEIKKGLLDANLGGNVIKKRIAVAGRGKSGGVRTLLAYQLGNKAFFIYGFNKNTRANIKSDELKVLKRYARELLSYDDKLIAKAIYENVLFEVKNNEQINT